MRRKHESTEAKNNRVSILAIERSCFLTVGLDACRQLRMKANTKMNEYRMLFMANKYRIIP